MMSVAAETFLPAAQKIREFSPFELPMQTEGSFVAVSASLWRQIREKGVGSALPKQGNFLNSAAKRTQEVMSHYLEVALSRGEDAVDHFLPPPPLPQSRSAKGVVALEQSPSHSSPSAISLTSSAGGGSPGCCNPPKSGASLSATVASYSDHPSLKHDLMTDLIAAVDLNAQDPALTTTTTTSSSECPSNGTEIDTSSRTRSPAADERILEASEAPGEASSVKWSVACNSPAVDRVSLPETRTSLSKPERIGTILITVRYRLASYMIECGESTKQVTILVSKRMLEGFQDTVAPFMPHGYSSLATEQLEALQRLVSPRLAAVVSRASFAKDRTQELVMARWQESASTFRPRLAELLNTHDALEQWNRYRERAVITYESLWPLSSAQIERISSATSERYEAARDVVLSNVSDGRLVMSCFGATALRKFEEIKGLAREWILFPGHSRPADTAGHAVVQEGASGVSALSLKAQLLVAKKYLLAASETLEGRVGILKSDLVSALQSFEGSIRDRVTSLANGSAVVLDLQKLLSPKAAHMNLGFLPRFVLGLLGSLDNEGKDTEHQRQQSDEVPTESDLTGSSADCPAVDGACASS